MNALLAKYAALPRAAKWGVWAAGFLIAYFGVIEPYVTYVGQLTEQANSIEARLRQRAAVADKRANNDAALEAAIAIFGAPQISSASSPLAALDDKVSQLLKARNIGERQRFTRDNNPTITTAAGLKLKPYSIEIQFDCETADLTGLLKDIEASPDIAAISRLDIRRISEVNPKVGGGQLSVTMVVDAWSIAKEEAGSSASSGTSGGIN